MSNIIPSLHWKPGFGASQSIATTDYGFYMVAPHGGEWWLSWCPVGATVSLGIFGSKMAAMLAASDHLGDSE